MKYIALFNIDDYADNGGGLQEPELMNATNLEDAKREAISMIRERGQKDGNENNSYSVDRFEILGVAEEAAIDIVEMNKQLKAEIEARKQNKAREKEVEQMMKLMQRYPDEAKQIVVDNDVGK